MPVRPWLQVLSGAIVVFGVLWMQWPGFADPIWSVMDRAARAGWPDHIVGFDKTFLPLPRLVHALALAYFLSSFAIVRQACASVWLWPFAMLGRHSLPVFALLSIIAFALQALRTQIGTDPGQDALLLGAGILAMFALAAAQEYWPRD